MRKLVFIGLVTLLPLTGVAQQDRPALPALNFNSLSSDHAFALGVGLLGGAVGLHALLGGTTWTLAGGAVGALVGDWWHYQRSGRINNHMTARKGPEATLAAN